MLMSRVLIDVAGFDNLVVNDSCTMIYLFIP